MPACAVNLSVKGLGALSTAGRGSDGSSESTRVPRRKPLKLLADLWSVIDGLPGEANWGRRVQGEMDRGSILESQWTHFSVFKPPVP